MVRTAPKRTFWARLKEALAAAKRPTTQEYAAKIAKVKQPTISGVWNKAGGVPELDTGVALANELNVCVEWLYMERGPMHPLPASDAYATELMSVWAQLDDKTKRALVGYAIGKANGIDENVSPFASDRPASVRVTKATD